MSAAHSKIWPDNQILESGLQCQLLEQRPSEECGCPEELWLMGNLEVTIHLEDDGSGHIIADAGDWDADLDVECDGMADLRSKAVQWIDQFPKEE
jgi:hypothetical protein